MRGNLILEGVWSVFLASVCQWFEPVLETVRGLGLGLGWEVQHVSAAGSIDLGKRHQEHIEDDDPPHVVGQLLPPEEGLGLVEQGEGQLVKLWLDRQLFVQQGWEGLVRLLGQLHQLWLD